MRHGPEPDQVWDLVRAQRRELAEIEVRLEVEFAKLAAALEQRSSDGQNAEELRAAIDDRLGRLAALEGGLNELRDGLGQSLEAGRKEQAALLAQIEQASRQLDDRHAELRQERTKLRDGQREAGRLRERCNAELKHLGEERERYARRSRELEAEFDDLAAMRVRTAAQRQRIAEELRDRRSELQAELQQRSVRLEAEAAARQREHEETLVALIRQKDDCEFRLQTTGRERDALQAELVAARRQSDELSRLLAQREAGGEEIEQLRGQLDLARQQSSAAIREQNHVLEQFQALRDENAGLVKQVQQLEAEVQAARGQADSASPALAEQIDRLAAENAHWAGQAAAAEERAAALDQELSETSRELAGLQRQLSQMTAEDSTGELADLRRRLEMAVDDLKAERSRNADLQKRVAQVSGQPAAVGGGASDWESQKRRLLAALEADEAGGAPSLSPQERQQIEQALRETERVVRDKDREIDELRQRLNQQSSQFGSMAVGAAAVAEVLDKDEIVQQERENLQQLQREWREKLRQAEVDISVERAKLARERADLEEKLRQYEHQLAQQAKEAAANPQSKPAKPDRGRWLTRLGLKEAGE